MAEIERWSLEGIEPPAHLEGDDGAARLVLPFHGFEIGFTVRLERDRAANLMRFVDLGQRETRVLTHFYREIVTGRAVSENAMIAAMDAPVEPVPMHLTPEEAAHAPRPAIPRAVRAASVLGLYAVLAVLVYGPLIAPIHYALKAQLAGPAPVRAEQTHQPAAPEGSAEEARTDFADLPH